MIWDTKGRVFPRGAGTGRPNQEDFIEPNDPQEIEELQTFLRSVTDEEGEIEEAKG